MQPVSGARTGMCFAPERLESGQASGVAEAVKPQFSIRVVADSDPRHKPDEPDCEKQ